ncbi:Hypothetical protein CAP_0279 [Chondromyces apiculatus DSM 436]|uniref:Uncharacterized protein n=1 Tax=Chondromyces apiculatus DSM 436 TaxID=1192034 RepID=A0A017TG11_9BACT|nr:Hypothetical protein CAP_0279 [Chondromyces apiculatus DSM 436]
MTMIIAGGDGWPGATPHEVGRVHAAQTPRRRLAEAGADESVKRADES